MKRFLTKNLSTKETKALINAFSKFRVFFTVLGILGMLWSFVPWNLIEAHVNEDESDYTYVIPETTNSLTDYPTTTDPDFDPSNVAFNSEVISERTETTKTFRKIDGTYEVAMYDDFIHYLEDGEYTQIDNSLLDLGNELTNKENKFKVKFPKKLDDNKQIKLSMYGYNIDWRVLNIDESNVFYEDSSITPNNIKELPNINQALLYSNIQNNVDLEYILTGSGVKENIILNDYTQDFSLSFEYKLKDLEIIQDLEGNVFFVNELDEVVFTFQDLYMLDDEMNYSEDIDFDVVSTGNKTYIITMTPNDEWLQEAEYPVIVDPSIILDYSWATNGIRDKYVYTNGYADDSDLKTGNNGTHIYKSYIEIPTVNIPDNVIVNYAQLRLRTTVSGSNIMNYCDDNDCQVNLRSVNPSITWDDIENNEFDDVSSSIIDYEIVYNTGEVGFVYSLDYYYWDFTKVAKDWYENDVNLGILEISNDNNIPTDYIWFSSELQGTVGPKITIGYQSTTGLYNYWTYHDAPVGDAGTAFINDYTGELNFVRNDYMGRHSGMNLNLSMFYSENLKNVNTYYGMGWRTNFDSTAHYDSNRKYIIEPSGAEIDFYPTVCSDVSDVDDLQIQTGCYLADDGSNRVMQYHEQDPYIIVYTPDQIMYTYQFSNGKLEEITDLKTDYYVDIIYSGSQITSVVDHYGNKLDFEYSGTYLDYVNSYLCQTWDINDICTSYNQVEKIDYAVIFDSTAGGYTLYSVAYFKDYKGDDDVFQPGSPDVAYYDYFSGGRLHYAESSAGGKVTFLHGTYNDKVEKYFFYKDDTLLGFIDPTYQKNYTQFEDHLGNQVKYTFDGYGHTVNILDDKGNATFYEYLNPFSVSIASPNYSLNHRLVKSSQPQKTQINPIQNHSFELNTDRWYVTVDAYAGATNIQASGFTSSQSIFGDESAFIFLNADQKAHYYQTVELDAGFYTVSGYIKTDALGSAHLNVSGNITGNSKNSTNTSSTDWTYVEINFEVLSDNSSVLINLYSEDGGDAWFDNIQILDGFRDSRENLLYNQSFEFGTVGWTLSGASSSIWEIPDFDGTLDDILGDSKIYISGDPTTIKYIEETITSSDITVDSNYIVGLWVKGDVTPSKYNGVNYNDRAYGLEVILYDSLGQVVVGGGYFPFNSYVEEWQYVVNEFYVDVSVASIKLRAVFKGEGSVYLDGFQLYQQSLGTTYEYDNVGNIKKVVTPGSKGEITYDYQLGTLYIPDTITDPYGNVIDYDFDNDSQFGNVKVNNVTVDVDRNDNNQVTSVSIGEDGNDDGEVGNVYQDSYYMNFISYTADMQYISQTENEFGATIDYETNLLNGLLESFENEVSITTTYEYDNKGRVIQVSKDSSNNYYVYVDDLLEEIQVNGFTYRLFYDSLDRLTKVDVGTGSGAGFSGSLLRDYVYDTVAVDTNGDDITDTSFNTNHISEEIFGNYDGIKFTYNDENQVTGVWFKTCETCSYVRRYKYEYNQVGDIVVIKDLRDSEEFYYDYDLVGRIEKVTSQDGDVVSYEYDTAGNLKVYTYDIQGYSRDISYVHDLINSEYDKTTVGGYTKDYVFESDNLRRLSSVVITLDTTTTLNTITYSYIDGYENITHGSSSTRILDVTQVFDGVTHSETLDYDDQGYITKITNQSGQVIQYYYDNKGQLIRENNQIDSYTYIYNYDNYGNITSQYFYGFSFGSLSIPNKVEWYTYSNTWKDQVSQSGISYPTNSSANYTVDYSYDGAGNITLTTDSRSSYYNERFTWEGRSLLTYSYYYTSASYTYNQNDIRDSKTVNGVTTNYYLDGTKVLFETDGTNEIYYTYDVDGTLLSMDYNGTEYYYVLNILGDVTHLLDSTGNIVVEYRYDAYGNLDDSITLSGVGLANPYRYRSYRYDNETGYYYLQSRYYNPETGRFINADGMLQSSNTTLGHNMYTYVNNNPIIYVDDLGYNLIINPRLDTSVKNAQTEESPYLFEPIVSHGSIKHSKNGTTYAIYNQFRIHGPSAIDDGFQLFDIWWLVSEEHHTIDGSEYIVNMGEFTGKAAFTSNYFGAEAGVIVWSSTRETSLDFIGIDKTFVGEVNVGLGATLKFEDGKFQFGLTIGVGFKITIE